MPAYLLQVPPGNGRTFESGRNAAVVFAADATDAIAVAQGLSANDRNESFVGATATAIVADTDLSAWTLRVKVLGASPAIDYEVLGATGNGIDDLGTAMAVALNTDAQIAGAAYVGATQVLTVSDVADALGDLTLLVEFKPPITTHPGAIAIPGLVASQVDGGIAAAALTVTFAADAYVLPAAYALLNDAT